MASDLSSRWLEAFGLSKRGRPDLFFPDDPVEDNPHSMALRIAFTKLRLSGIFCVAGVPTIGFLVLDQDEPQRIDSIHRALWNQGLMSLLLVITGDTVRAFSLARKPTKDGLDQDRVLVKELERVADALELKEIILGVESGRWWEENSDYFDASERVDEVLLDNLTTSFKELTQSTEDNLDAQSAQTLIMQTIFICYLEDREIVQPGLVQDATNRHFKTLKEILEAGDVAGLRRLFSTLNRAFNGNIFTALGTFSEKRNSSEKRNRPDVSKRHLGILSRFRDGKEEMRSRQARFWGYNFRYIPVELLSAVYDRFLSENEYRRQEGAYYTPMFLADTVTCQAAEYVANFSNTIKILDPACGSGIFLVRAFQAIVENRRSKRSGRELTWTQLIKIAGNLFGNDINKNALQVTLFSLYLAMLEQRSPPDIRKLMDQGKMLPALWGKSLRPSSFFDLKESEKYDLIIGNPPWSSRRQDVGGAMAWCDREETHPPSNEVAWAFLWKSARHLHPNGVSVLLLPAMGLLLNQAASSVRERARMFVSQKVLRVINLSDLVSQLFPKAKRPAAIFVITTNPTPDKGYRFEYWHPKADLNLRQKRAILLPNHDRSRLRSDMIASDPGLFKRKIWMRPPDERLLQYIQSLPTVGDMVMEFRTISRNEVLRNSIDWAIGQGFKPANQDRLSDPDYDTYPSDPIRKHSFLDAKSFQALCLPSISTAPFSEELVHRIGFLEGFEGPHIIIPQGIIRDDGHLRAAYTEQSLSFEHSLQGISVPVDETFTAKLLTVVLNSRLVAWFLFHTAANLGTERAKVLQKEILEIPFAKPSEMPNQKSAQEAANIIVRKFDDLMDASSNLLSSEPDPREFDNDVYKYFGLSNDEIAIVEDTYKYLIPAMQPTARDFPEIWRTSNKQQREAYTNTLARKLSNWVEDGFSISASLEGIGRDLAVLSLEVVRNSKSTPYKEPPHTPRMTQVLDRIWANIPAQLPGNFQAIPDLRIFLNGKLYLVKPIQVRHWLRSTALADADAIAADLNRAARQPDTKRQAH